MAVTLHTLRLASFLSLSFSFLSHLPELLPQTGRGQENKAVIFIGVWTAFDEREQRERAGHRDNHIPCFAFLIFSHLENRRHIRLSACCKRPVDL